MLSRNVVVTGASRGLGLEIVKQLTKTKGGPEKVIAACRKPDQAAELQTLKSEHGGTLFIVQLDVADHQSFEPFVNNELKVSYFLIFMFFFIRPNDKNEICSP